MNSKQRRKDSRKWKYHVQCPPDRAYENYDAMFDWCVATFGNGLQTTWREKHGHYGTHWQFNKEKDAVLFALRWMG